jgi:hypothetical protein
MQTLANKMIVAPDNDVTFTTGSAITVGFDATAHGYLTDLGADDPTTVGAITYVTATGISATCAGTTKLLCDAVR